MSSENCKEIFEKAFDSGDKKEQYVAACKLQAMAVELLIKSADCHFIESVYKLGMCYELGCGVEIDYTKAVSYYKKVTEYAENEINSDAEMSQKALADELREESDNDMSEYSFEELMKYATIHKNIQAQYELGLLYQYGDNSIEKDMQKSLHWYLKAARKGHESAMLSLAEHYESSGRLEEAAKWYRKYAAARITWRDRYKSK